MPLNDHARAQRAMPPLHRDILLIARHAISLAALTEEVPAAALEITAYALAEICRRLTEEGECDAVH
ncbi:hypothetical protein PQR65_19765 [Paraburkholderia nemoris]|uniref:Prophage protein n=1 Tax=Paraburkholderia metrosideri TaxID=580937 RepID=A0ABW9DMW6_9BURK